MSKQQASSPTRCGVPELELRAKTLGPATLIAGLVLCASLFIALTWRAALPNTRGASTLGYVAVETDGRPYFFPRDVHRYDDALTAVTAQNFARNGFWRSHGLPNRRGAPRVSLYDTSQTQCEPIAEVTHAITERNAFGRQVLDVSASIDCVHIHYPPLSDWLFAGLAWCGLGSVFCYKVLAILANCAFLLLFFIWLRREVTGPSALAALLFAASVPAFLDWADALYFHSFQFLFWAASMLACSVFLESRRRTSLAITWLAFFAGALVSPQLTLAMAVTLAGSCLLEPAPGELRARLKLVGALATAPLAALLLQLGLATSLFGVQRVWQNLARTLADRVHDAPPGGVTELVHNAQSALLPMPVVLLSLLLIVVARRATGAPLARCLALLGILWTAALSFALAFPGTAAWHGSSIYRHFWPFAVLLVAFFTEAWLSLAAQLKARYSARGQLPERARARLALLRPGALALLGGLALGVAELGWLSLRGFTALSQEARWSLLQNQRADSGNLARRALDVLYWTDGVPRYRGLLLMPVSGIRVSSAHAWLADFQIADSAPSHYEIWWLRPESIGRVRILVDDLRGSSASGHCFVSWFDGRAFQAPPAALPVTRAVFLPAPGEATPREPYAWVNFLLPKAVRALAVRVSCAGEPSLTLHQIEVFSS